MWADLSDMPWRGADGLWNRDLLLLAAVVAMGIIVGAMTAYGGWMYAVALVTLAFVMRWPVPIALGVLYLLIPFDNVSVLGMDASGATLNRYAGGFAVFVLLVVGLATKRLSLPPRPLFWWSIFVFWGTATIAWAVDTDAALEKLPTAFSLLLLFLVCSSFQVRRSELSVVLFMTVLGGCVAALLASTQFFSGTMFRGTTRASLMIGGRETDPNQFAASLLLPFSLALGSLIWARTRLIRVGATLVTSVIGLALLLTMSRGGLMAMLVVLGIYFYRLRLNKRIFVAIACIGLLLLALPQSFYERLTLSDRGAGRFDIWIASLGLIPHYGFFGAGWNNFTTIYMEVAGDAPKFHGFTEGAHNIYIGTLLEAGIVGCVMLLFALRSQLREARYIAVVPYAAACWGMLTMGATLDILWRKSFWLCWILLAMAVRVTRAEEAS